MKTLKIYSRSVTERTGYRKFPFKAVEQITVTYGDKEYSNHSEEINNPRLRIPFGLILNTRRKEDAERYMNRLDRRSANGRWLKDILQDIISGKETV